MISAASSKKTGFGAQRVKTNFNALEATAKREEKEVVVQPELPKEKYAINSLRMFKLIEFCSSISFMMSLFTI